MNRYQLANELATSERLTLSTAVKAVDGIVRIIKGCTRKRRRSHLRGFATISPVMREQRQARHFKTGEMITVPAYRTAKIRASQELKDAMNNNQKGGKHGNVD